MEKMTTKSLHTASVSAPGKVILHGEHAVVYGKTAIAVSIGLRSSIVIKEIKTVGEPTVHIHLPCVRLEETLPLTPLLNILPSVDSPWQSPNKLDHERHLERVDRVLSTLKPDFSSLENNQKNSLRSFLYAFSGIFANSSLHVSSLDISLGSELTIGAGTGSSASFAVCLSAALVQLLKVKTSTNGAEEPLDHQGFSDEEKEIICGWAYNCERIIHGTPSGVDNTTCTYGSVVLFKRGTKAKRLDLKLSLRVLLVDTGVARETCRLTGTVAELRQRNLAAVDHIMDACDEVAHTATQILEKLSTGKGTSSIEADYKRLSELWDMNHCLLAALGVSHPALEAIRGAARARELACKLTGAGGGGYAMVLIPPSTPRSSIDSLTDELLENKFRVTETTLGGAGVSLKI